MTKIRRPVDAAPGLDLVTWPTPDNNWRDGGEGGLFAYALWGHEQRWDRCSVEHIVDVTIWNATSGIHGPMAETLQEGLSEARSALSRIHDHTDKTHSEYYDARAEAETVLWGAGPVLYLGSTPYSLWDETEGEHFQVAGVDDLTPLGRSLIAAATEAYGEPTYLTLLDT